MSTSLVRPNRPQPRLADSPINPEQIHTTADTLLNATIKLLREHLPMGSFKIQRVDGTNEAVITHYHKDGLEFFRLKISR